MEEESVTRRRNLENTSDKKENMLPLYENLALLLGDRHYIKLIHDPVSLSLRCAILSELIINDFISLSSSNKVTIVSTSTDDVILLKTLNLLDKDNLSIKEWLEVLNGENYKIRHQLKNTRKIIYKKLEENNLIKYKNYLHKKSIQIIDQRYKSILCNNLINYLIKKEVNLYYDVLICGLFYCKIINDLFVSLSPQQQSLCRFRVEDVLNRYRNYYKRENVKEEMIALLLKAFLKKF